MAKKKVKNKPLESNFDATAKHLTIQDIEEIVDYYKYYGANTDNEFKAIDIVRVGNELLRLRTLLQDIVDKAEDIIENGSLEAMLFEDIQKIAKEGLKENKRV